MFKKIKYDFKEAIMEIDSLKDFLLNHSKLMNDEYSNFLRKYEVGLTIAELFDEIVSATDKEAKKHLIEQTKEKIIVENKMLKDILSIEYEQDEECGLQYSYTSELPKTYNPKVADERKRAYKKQEKIFSQSILSNAIIIFESYLAKVYEVLVLKFPYIYLENKQISLASIFNEDLMSVVKKQLDNEIEKNMYDTLDTLDKMKEKSGFDIERYYKIRKKFEEVYYRRNVYVHNNGKANNIYFSKVDINYRKKININQYLECSEEYLLNSISITKKIICAMFYELLKVLEADNEIYDTLSDVGFEALCSNEYKNAEHIYCMLSQTRKFQFKDKAMYQINYIIALKQQGKNIRTLLDNFDVSIATDEFVIAKLCLEDKNVEVFGMIEKTYPKPFPAQAIREWPLFIDFRKTEYYEILERNHPDDFNKFVFDEKNCSTEKLSLSIEEDSIQIVSQ